MTADIVEMFDCRVINLARRADRRKWFRKQNLSAGIRIEVFDAIDGAGVDMRTAVADGVIAPETKYTPGAVGVGMSHRHLWRECLAQKKPALVFEDDAALRSDVGAVLPRLVSQLGENWDIILLGYNTDSVLDLNLWKGGIDLRAVFSVAVPTPAQLTAFSASREAVALYRLNSAFGLCGYVISPRGAASLLPKCFPMDNRVIRIPALGRSIISTGLDCMLNAAYASVAAYACFTPLVVPVNDRKRSSVQEL
jgi:GR25 family glycosyltransferase involved in LPS biosynthesis